MDGTRSWLGDTAEGGSEPICGDSSAALSPHGDKVAFVRSTGNVQSRLLWAPINRECRISGPARILETGFVTHMSARWIQNGNGLLISGGAGAWGHLYRMLLEERAAPEPVISGLDVTGFELHPSSGRAICECPSQTINIWELPLKEGRIAGDPMPLTSSTHLNIRPLYSPDGNWIAFTSTRAGYPSLWIMDRCGSRIMRLATPDSAVSEATDWSPDSKSIYFFSNPCSQYDVFSIDVESGSIRQITRNPANDWRARCSKNGNSIYFTSSRQDQFLLWRMPASGGEAMPVTTRSASCAHESLDGRWLYYAEYPAGGLYRKPLGGGPEEQVVTSILDPSSYAVSEQGIYYLVRAPGANQRRYSLGVRFARADLRFLNTATGEDRLLMHFSRPIYGGLDLSPDGCSLAYAEVERDTQELAIIENFL